MPIKSKFWKIDKNTWRFYHLTHMQPKWQSYDVWIQRYGAWHPGFFVILDYFLACYSPNNSENQNFQKMKNAWISSHFTNVYHKWKSHAVRFLRYGTWWTEVFYPTNNLQNQNFKKMKVLPRDIFILHMCTITDNHGMVPEI